MKITKEKILELLRSKEYQAMSAHQLGNYFKIGNKDDFRILGKLLDSLEEECLVYRSKTDRYFAPEKTGLKRGIVNLNKKGFGFIMIDDEDDDIFVSQEHLHGAMNKDQVLVAIFNNTSGNSQSGEIQAIGKRGQNLVVGLLKQDRRGYHVLPDDEKIKDKILIHNVGSAMDGHKVVVQIEQYEPLLKGNVVEIIGHVNDPGVDILSIVYRHEINIEFPEEVMEEVKTVEDVVNPKDKIGRTDLTNEAIVTIDGDDAKDLDDAIQVKKLDNGNYELGVHIADVAHYVKEYQPLDMEAAERGTSVYLVDRVIPMLPHRLSNGICSLNPKVERLTLSCVMEIDHHGDVVDHKIFASFIKTKERMTYKNVNKILANDKEQIDRYESLVPMFNDMEELSKVLRKKREKRGAIDFDINEAKVIVDENGKPTDVIIRERGTSEKIIEEFMLCANETVAEHFKWLELPFVYRVHENPKLKKLRAFANIAKVMGYHIKGSLENIHPSNLQQIIEDTKDMEQHSLIATLLLRSMQKARYDVDCLGHFGLANQYYTHFTSPIRRYPDLLVHRLIHTYLIDQKIDGKTIAHFNEVLPMLVENSSLKEVTAVNCERDVEDMKKAEYMESHIGEEFEGIISSVTGFGFFVELPNTIEGLVHISELKDDYYHYVEDRMELTGEVSGHTYKMSDKVKIQVKAASKQAGTIDFVVVSKTPTKKKKVSYDLKDKPKNTSKHKGKMSGRYNQDHKRKGISKKTNEKNVENKPKKEGQSNNPHFKSNNKNQSTNKNKTNGSKRGKIDHRGGSRENKKR